MKKRIVILILCVAMLMTVLASCSKEENVQESEETVQTETETEYLPKADFDGYEFTILGREVDNSYIIVGEYTDVPLEQSIYEMNCAVSERYNITFNYVMSETEMVDEARNANLAGDDIYDVVTTHAKHSFTLFSL